MKQVKTSADYYQFTPEMLSYIRHHKIKGVARDVFDFLSLNQNIFRGKLKSQSIEDIANELGHKPRSIYYALAKLEKAGLYTPIKWGKIDGYMPMTQLANSKIKQSKDDKRHKAFYKELQKRIDKSAKGRFGPLPARMIESLYLKLCKERKESNHFFPIIDDEITPDTIQKEIDRYLHSEEEGYV